MIVKNESKAIKRCLDSVKDIIDTWVIVDTGSTDGTQDIIRSYLCDKPGQLYERPWVNFEHNRNEALVLAQGKADYILFIDADEQLRFLAPFNKQALVQDCYLCRVQEPRTCYKRALLIKDSISWRWEGILHETIVGPESGYTEDTLSEVVNVSLTVDGARSQDPDKYKKDAEILKKAFADHPTEVRYLFYLGQSYLNMIDYPQALKAFEQCLSLLDPCCEMGWYSAYIVARLHEILENGAVSPLDEYCKVFQIRPLRVEPLFYVSRYALSRHNPMVGYTLMPIALSLPFPQEDHIHIEHWLYDYGLLLMYADCSDAMGKQQQARALYEKLLTIETVPVEIVNAVKSKLANDASKTVEREAA